MKNMFMLLSEPIIGGAMKVESRREKFPYLQRSGCLVSDQKFETKQQK